MNETMKRAFILLCVGIVHAQRFGRVSGCSEVVSVFVSLLLLCFL